MPRECCALAVLYAVRVAWQGVLPERAAVTCGCCGAVLDVERRESAFQDAERRGSAFLWIVRPSAAERAGE